jgi:Tol biopolymer transport system component
MKRSMAVLGLFLGICMSPAGLFAFGQNKIVYDKFNWSVYHSTHFDVYFYVEEKPSLQKVVDVAESAYDDLSRKLNHQVTKKIPLIYYATHSAFEQNNVELDFISEDIGAFTEPVRNRMVIPIDTTDEKLLQLVQHELTHAFQFDILFQGKLGKTITSNPPAWFMEGMASFMASDEDNKDRMILRDAVVTDQVPSIERAPNGYFAYRFGHAVFRYIQETRGWDGLRDFVYEYRNTLGSSIDKALKRAFDQTPEEFNTHFRTWLRKQYLPALISKGEPAEYGDPFRVNDDIQSQENSPVISPSGDLLAAFTTYKDHVDVVLFNVPQRKLLRNLTGGYTSRYEYPIAQWLTIGPALGGDIAFSSNGDHLAIFVKKERGRNLLLLNALAGTIEKSIPMDVEQQLNPVFSPDARKIAFSGFRGNQSDLFLYDIASNTTVNLTNDSFYDAAPVFSPDGKWIVYSSIVDGYAKLFRLEVANPTNRFQITTGPFNDSDASFSPDGKRVFFASDRQTGRNIEKAAQILDAAEKAAKPSGEATPPADLENFAAYNIYSLNLESGDLLQYTDVVGGAFTPQVFIGTNNKERLVFSSYYKRRFRLYSTTTDKPLHAAEKVTIPSAPMTLAQRPSFLPPVEVTVDPDKVDKAGGFKLFVDDIAVNAGVDSNQTFISRSVIDMSDMMGDRRFIASLDSVSTFSNFDFLYLDLKRRLNWGFRVFDDREFFASQNVDTGLIDRRQAIRETGALGVLSYPFNRYHRIDVAAGYLERSINYPLSFLSNGLPDQFLTFKDSFPIVTSTLTGDDTQFKQFGPIAGHRYELTGSYAPDLHGSGALTRDIVVDARTYLPITSRSLLAARLFTGYASGTRPDLFYFGGLNTLRGYDFREFFGNRAAYANVELRFPFIDYLITPFAGLQQIRGSVFFDVGAANLTGQKFSFYNNGHLQDGKASVGYGISLNLLGLELHFDFAKRTDLQNYSGPFRSTFWIGETF